MRVKLKGVNRVAKRLADGSQVTYWYAWKGGPRLAGKPGSPEFVASYADAVATRKQAAAGVLQTVLDGYQSSTKFTGLADRAATAGGDGRGGIARRRVVRRARCQEPEHTARYQH